MFSLTKTCAAAIGVDGLDEQVADGQARHRERARRVGRGAVLALVGEAGHAQQRARQRRAPSSASVRPVIVPRPTKTRLTFSRWPGRLSENAQPLVSPDSGSTHHEAQRVGRVQHEVELVAARLVGDLLGDADHRAAFAAALELVEQAHARERRACRRPCSTCAAHHRRGVADGDDDRHRRPCRVDWPAASSHAGHHGDARATNGPTASRRATYATRRPGCSATPLTRLPATETP